MIDTMEEYAVSHNLVFSTDPNPVKCKTKCMAYLKRQRVLPNMTLCVVYTNDLPDVIHTHPVDYKEPLVHCREDGSMVNFVDEGTVYVTDKSSEVVNQKLTNHYSLIEDYMQSNKLVINSEKSHLIMMAGRGAAGARRMDVQVKAGPDMVEQSVSRKLLGYTIVAGGMKW